MRHTQTEESSIVGYQADPARLRCPYGIIAVGPWGSPIKGFSVPNDGDKQIKSDAETAIRYTSQNCDMDEIAIEVRCESGNIITKTGSAVFAVVRGVRFRATTEIANITMGYL